MVLAVHKTGAGGLGCAVHTELCREHLSRINNLNKARKASSQIKFGGSAQPLLKLLGILHVQDQMNSTELFLYIPCTAVHGSE